MFSSMLYIVWMLVRYFSMWARVLLCCYCWLGWSNIWVISLFLRQLQYWWQVSESWGLGWGNFLEPLAVSSFGGPMSDSCYLRALDINN